MVDRARRDLNSSLAAKALVRVGSAGQMGVKVHFDINGRDLVLEETVVRELRAKAKAAAGSSTVSRDLAAPLTRALSESRPVALQRVEARALFRLLGHDPALPLSRVTRLH
jgi:hypothetical protein